jgi:hypothetical protein
MKQFLIYKTATGEILRTGLCADADISFQVQNEQETLLETTANFKLEYVVDGAVVPLPPKPGDSFVFDYTTKQWVDTRTNDTQWALVRDERNQKLQASDWTQMPDVTIPNKTEWATYRQELRDVTNQPDPFSIVWPTPPQ